MKPNSLLSTIAVLLSLVGAVWAQKVTMSPLSITRSEFVEKLRALRKENPKLTASEFAVVANEMMEKDGLPFAISFEAATCQRLRTVKAQQKDPNAPLRLGATLKSVDADGAALALPEPRFSSQACGDCYVELPLLEVTEKDFITKLMGANIKFQLPSNFYTNEAVLFDADDANTRRRWRIPFRSTPIGISYDENVLYLGFAEPDLAELALMMFGEGVFQIGTRAEAEEGGKGTVVADGDTGISRIKFNRWSKSYSIGFKKPCQ